MEQFHADAATFRRHRQGITNETDPIPDQIWKGNDDVKEEFQTNSVVVRMARVGRNCLWLQCFDRASIAAADYSYGAYLFSGGDVRDSDPTAMVLTKLGPLFSPIRLVELC